MRAIAADADGIILGSVSSDAFHADGTEHFYSLMDSVMSTQEGHLAVQVPAIHMTSVELVRKSRITFSLLGWTHSCHRAEFACGFCRGCTKHRGVMLEVGYGDSQT
jgi:7-cyano-7-deazaguanine synthase